ncbi:MULTISPECIES: stage II sporulation protein M [unclassified Clostridium]|uniref:stage II sporulation protein M n=1 Tax=unclassified Clostridium TaxID=2614128 RepID=UPI0018975A92|nr:MULTISPECIES: stage II sporulation protein M [unclassified Clostridium]MCR1949767.1 stage II sporulation protein M [Clostridium sp. DSM 100503]
MNLIEKLNSNFRENKIFYLLVLTFFFVGILLGSYTIKYMDGVDAKDLADYFTGFIKSINVEEVKTNELLISIIKNNIVIILLIIALGFTVFGAPIILIIDLIKGFTLGYTFSFLLTTFEGKGVWLALASTVPQNIFYIPFFIGISIISLELSSVKLKEKFFNGIGSSKLMFNGLVMKLSFFVILFAIGVIIECYMSPGLIKMVVTKVYKLT